MPKKPPTPYDLVLIHIEEQREGRGRLEPPLVLIHIEEQREGRGRLEPAKERTDQRRRELAAAWKALNDPATYRRLSDRFYAEDRRSVGDPP